MASDKNWAVGVFATERQGKFGPIINLGINKNEFLDWFDTLPANSRGFVNLSMSPAKDEGKWTMWENVQEERPANGQRNSGQQRRDAPAPRNTGYQNNQQQNNYRQNTQARRTTTQSRGRQAPQNQDEDDGSALPF